MTSSNDFNVFFLGSLIFRSPTNMVVVVAAAAAVVGVVVDVVVVSIMVKSKVDAAFDTVNVFVAYIDQYRL